MFRALSRVIQIFSFFSFVATATMVWRRCVKIRNYTQLRLTHIYVWSIFKRQQIMHNKKTRDWIKWQEEMWISMYDVHANKWQETGKLHQYLMCFCGKFSSELVFISKLTLLVLTRLIQIALCRRSLSARTVIQSGLYMLSGNVLCWNNGVALFGSVFYPWLYKK